MAGGGDCRVSQHERRAQITVNLLGMGSMEGASAVLDGSASTPIHVWSPASTYRDHFERQWRAMNSSKSPILKSENLALTPMVLVLWERTQGSS